MVKEKGMELLPGRRLGDYQVLEELGAGATARVYRVREITGGQIYALKYSVYMDLIHQESTVLRQLNHPCFPGWIAEGRDGKAAYLVMEYIPGMALQRLMEQYPAGMPEQMAAGIGLDVAAGLAYLHSMQPCCIYRDMKAANVMITPEGRARVIDLGAVVCPEEGNARKYRAGTYGYGAPEQFWEGTGITPACDIYGMGKLLAFLLTGQDPGKPPYDTVQYYRRHAGVRKAFRQLLDQCLQQDPQLRYPDASFLLPQLAELVSGKRHLQPVRQVITGKKRSYRYIKCIWKSEYKRIF